MENPKVIIFTGELGSAFKIKKTLLSDETYY
jgi:hypothetical protein